MSKKHLQITGAFTAIIIMLVAGIFFWPPANSEKATAEIEEVKLDPVEKKKARSEYFFRMLRDPATDRIPDNIRSRELEHAKQIPGRTGGFLQKGQSAQQAPDLTWQLAGPNELGGRTRALAVDQRDSDVILAGGVSGGMWKSEDGGDSWEMKTDPDQNMSVSSVAQDPTSPDTWYYASGELRGNTAGAQQGSASYFGTGVFKSEDNGETWTRLASTEDTDTSWNSGFDYISRIVVNPTNGDVYFASNGVGIYRSQDKGSSFELVLGSSGGYRYADVVINKDGNILAALSQNSEGGTQIDSPGIHLSTDDGENWTDVTPSDFPSSHDRTYLAFAPSAPDTAYAFTYEGTGSGSNENISFFMLDFANDGSEDRSDNLPDFGGNVGFVNTQINYNMVVSVKPDDPDFVMVGGTNLFRSRDGFATKPSGGYDNSDDAQKDEYWIGGYDNDNDISQYPGQHPDQHVIVFPEPNTNPNLMWAGHDGGLSVTDDVTATAVSWQDRDEGYVTGQFYTVAIPSDTTNNRILGGTQDNGTPFFQIDDQGNQVKELTDISTGDGSYGYFTENFIFVSAQRGHIRRHEVNSNGDITGTAYSVEPPSASNQLFIHPYAVDPNDEGVMYYPDGSTMWRNTNMDGSMSGWDNYSGVSESGYIISTLEVTKALPSDRLYYAASSPGNGPKIFSVENASSNWEPEDISIPGAESGAYVHDIAVNPHDGDELIAVMSNYNTEGLYHSIDAGDNWTLIEGDLEGDSQNPGPSLRNATILPTSSETVYLVGTSTGVYSTTTLDGSNTSWAREYDDGTPGSIGYSVSEYIVSRPIDGKVAVGTHGRGIFVGDTGIEGVEPPGMDLTKSMDNNWELVGVPVASSNEISLGDDLTIFGFSGAYESTSTVEPQKGYWIKSRSGSEISFSGDENYSATLSLEEGWNMIGGITQTVPTSDINDPDNIVSTIYEYVSGSYESASEIKPAEGYWVHADQAGDIELVADTSSQKQPAQATESVNYLTFRSGNTAQKLYVAPKQLEQSERKQFLMPPQPPQPVLDVRTTDDYRLADGNSTELELTTNSYPVKVSVSPNSGSPYVLKGVTGADTVYHHLTPNQQAEIQRPYQKLLLQGGSAADMITEHDLLPNYPNPFNPTTQIQYQVASQADVSIEVFDVIGRRVRTLVDQQQQRGSYTVQFDGSDLSSGIYFIHLKAGSTTKLQKMTLIK